MDAGSFTKFPVKKGEVIRVAQPKGSTIKAESGELWITQKNIQDDIFLTRGETYHVFGDGLLVAQAMEPSLMSMTRVKRSSFMGGGPLHFPAVRW
ncbi:MAG: DUF2917 domain-containing protein [Rhodoferax sp.]